VTAAPSQAGVGVTAQVEKRPGDGGHREAVDFHHVLRRQQPGLDDAADAGPLIAAPQHE
jgi:hypothetical protein